MRQSAAHFCAAIVGVATLFVASNECHAQRVHSGGTPAAAPHHAIHPPQRLFGAASGIISAAVATGEADLLEPSYDQAISSPLFNPPQAPPGAYDSAAANTATLRTAEYDPAAGDIGPDPLVQPVSQYRYSQAYTYRPYYLYRRPWYFAPYGYPYGYGLYRPWYRGYGYGYGFRPYGYFGYRPYGYFGFSPYYAYRFPQYSWRYGYYGPGRYGFGGPYARPYLNYSGCYYW